MIVPAEPRAFFLVSQSYFQAQRERERERRGKRSVNGEGSGTKENERAKDVQVVALRAHREC